VSPLNPLSVSPCAALKSASYVPGGHGVHDVAPWAACVPAPQGSHRARSKLGTCQQGRRVFCYSKRCNHAKLWNGGAGRTSWVARRFVDGKRGRCESARSLDGWVAHRSGGARLADAEGGVLAALAVNARSLVGRRPLPRRALGADLVVQSDRAVWARAAEQRVLRVAAGLAERARVPRHVAAASAQQHHRVPLAAREDGEGHGHPRVEGLKPRRKRPSQPGGSGA
jgi:hypothetical protein